jgi:hypothetical protein
MGIGYVIGVTLSALVDLIWFSSDGHIASGPHGIG